MIIPILYSFAVDDVSGKNFNGAYIMIVISIIVTIIYRMSEHYNQVAYYNLYNKIYRKYTDISLSYTHRNSIYSLSRISLGEYTNIFNNDIDVISAFWTTSVVRIVRILEFLFIYLYFFGINFYVGLITIVISLIVFLIMFKYGERIEVLNKTRKELLDKKTAVLQEIFLGIKEIKGLNLISTINKRLHTSTNDYLDSNTKYNVDYNKNKFISLFIVEFFRLLLFAYGIYLISNNQMQIGVLLVIYNYYSKLIDNLNEIGTVNMEFRNLSTSLSRFNRLIEYSRNADKYVKELNDTSSGKITFEKVLYGNKENPYLNDVTFNISPCELTVITGKVGSDKNGVFDLLLRLNRQHSGKTTIDGIDLEVYDNDTYYNIVSSAREQPVFFSLSIKENLTIIEPDFSKIVDICKKLKIHDYIMNLENGYDTIITGSSDNINITMKHLLSIARVLLKDPKIMLFYDILGTFDKATLNNFINIMLDKKSDHTIVIISQDQGLLDLADKIITIEDGVVVNEIVQQTINDSIVK